MLETKLVEKEEKEQEDAVIIRLLETARDMHEKKIKEKRKKRN